MVPPRSGTGHTMGVVLLYPKGNCGSLVATTARKLPLGRLVKL